jgi:ABC-type polysaccharide transport system permease subunit
MFSYDGIMNNIVSFFGGNKLLFLLDNDIFRQIIIWSDVWKGMGYNMVIFLAAILGIDPHLYEAAKVEGCNKYEVFWKITFPMVSPMLLTCAVYTVVDAFVRSPIFEFLKVSQTTGSANFGLTSAIAVSFLVINLGVIGLVFILLKGLVFYYDKR